MDLYTYAHFLDKHGLSLEELQTVSALERVFYTASMVVMKEEDRDNQIALAKLSNPFISTKK